MDNSPRISELDLARAGIVSASQSAPLPPLDKEWTARFEANGVRYDVHGYSHRGRPFGIDGDLLLALQTLFFQAGCPDDNRIKVSPTSLMRLLPLSRSGKDHVRMREGLLRLASVRSEMTASWDGQSRREHRTTSTGIISDLWLDDDVGMEGHTGVQVSVDSQVEIVFTATFASMIRDGLYQILDGDLLARLGSSPARALYRSLAAHRIKHDHLAQEFTVNLRDWISALGLSPRADMALRTLNAAHERLTDEGYLQLVEDLGRGDKRQLVYRFLVDAQPEQVAALIQRGVVPAVAASLSAAHPDRIMPAIRRVEARVGTGWKPRSLPASIVDAVKDPEKWEYAEVPAQGPKRPRKRPAAAVKVSAPPEPFYTPQETVLSLLRVKLNREVTPKLSQQVHDLTPAGVEALRTALIMNSKEDAGRLAASILGEGTLSG